MKFYFLLFFFIFSKTLAAALNDQVWNSFKNEFNKTYHNYKNIQAHNELFNKGFTDYQKKLTSFSDMVIMH